jgi:ribonuclease HI
MVTEFGTPQSSPLPPNASVQLAELVALTETLKLSKDQRVNIYTDSKYAFLILHVHATIGKQR